jgi:hypothetical protein
MRVPLDRSAVFEPEVTAAMQAAFQAAWRRLKDSGSVLAAPFKADLTRKVLALRIIATARSGEHDIDRLRDDALMHVHNGGWPVS